MTASRPCCSTPAAASPLKQLLLEQILAAAPRWDVDTLVPRRVPRSAYRPARQSLAALDRHRFFVRPPRDATARRAPHASRIPDQPTRRITAEAQPRPQRRATGCRQTRRTGWRRRAAMQAWAGCSQSSRQIRGAAARRCQKPSRQAGKRADSGVARTGRTRRRAAPRNTERDGGAVAQAAGAAARGVTDKLQSAIRQALGAAMPSDGETGGERQTAAPETRSHRRATGADKPRVAAAATPDDATYREHG